MSLFMTPRQVADRWGCDDSTVRALCRSGALPSMRLGLKGWRIAVSAVEAYERARTGGPAAEVERSSQERAAVARTVTAVPSDFELSPGYVPIFPLLWGMTPEEAAVRAAGPGRSRTTKKRPSKAIERR